MKKIIINLSNRWLYTFIAIGIILIISVGVYAWANPTTGVGHDLSEIEPCAAGKILQTNTGGTAWECVNMPEPEASVDTRCDTSGTCSQVCIGVECESSWPSTSVSCTLINCVTYSFFLAETTEKICPNDKPFMKGVRMEYNSYYGPAAAIHCCSITCS